MFVLSGIRLLTYTQSGLSAAVNGICRAKLAPLDADLGVKRHETSPVMSANLAGIMVHWSEAAVAVLLSFMHTQICCTHSCSMSHHQAMTGFWHMLVVMAVADSPARG